MAHDIMGKFVTVTKQYNRQYKGSYRTWEPSDIEPIDGWVVGYRTIYDGYTDYDMGEYGDRQSENYFVRTGHKECILVSLSPRQNPINVPLDGILVQAELDAASGN